MAEEITIEKLLELKARKQKIVSDMIIERLALLRQFGGADGNDHHPEAFYDQLISETVSQIARNRTHYAKLAALCFAAIEALERENVNGG